MYIEKLKVRPRKNPPFNMCATQLNLMLSCMVTSGDVFHNGQCKTAATDLFHCMSTTPFRGKQPRPAINYHLARLSKKIQ